MEFVLIGITLLSSLLFALKGGYTGYWLDKQIEKDLTWFIVLWANFLRYDEGAEPKPREEVSML